MKDYYTGLPIFSPDGRALARKGEHVLTSEDVRLLGDPGSIDALRQALHEDPNA